MILLPVADAAEPVRALVKRLAGHNRLEFQWLARTFLNLTPGITSADCYVTAVNPDWHYARAHDLSQRVMAAVIRSWQFLEEQVSLCKLSGVGKPFFLSALGIPLLSNGRIRPTAIDGGPADPLRQDRRPAASIRDQ